jgi:hypothetical protein
LPYDFDKKMGEKFLWAAWVAVTGTDSIRRLLPANATA